MLTDPHSSEPLKATVHCALGILGAVCAIYNGVAYLRRKEPRLLMNTIVYAGLTCLEVYQVSRHIEHATTTPPPCTTHRTAPTKTQSDAS